MADTYVLEWSKMTNNLHMQPLDAMLSRNRCLYRDGRASNDYIPLIVGTREVVEEAAKAIRPTLRKREAANQEQARQGERGAA